VERRRVLVELHKLTKRFHDKVAVDKITIRLCRGDIYGLVGPNGAGKTTTIRMMVGLAKPTEGWVKVCGVRMDEKGHEARKFIGYVPDRALFYEKLTGREFLEFVGKLRGVEAEVLRKRIEMLAERFDITEEIDKLIESFSHGMKQRLAMCAAMLADPPIPYQVEILRIA